MLDRRQILAALATTGLGTPLFHRTLAGLQQESGDASGTSEVTAEMVKTAEWICGTEFTESERTAIAKSVNRSVKRVAELRNQSVSIGPRRHRILDLGRAPRAHARPDLRRGA